MISINDAARSLLEKFHAPSGAVNVLALQDDEGPHLIVWVDPAYIRRLKSIPETFEGYPVRVEPRPEVVAYKH